MSVSPQSLARTRDKRSHKIPARFNDTVYNEAHYVEATQTQVLRTSTRSRPGSVGIKRELEDEEQAEEKEEVIKFVKAPSRSSSHSKSGGKSSKSHGNEPPTTPITTAESIATITPLATSATTTTSSSSGTTTGAKITTTATTTLTTTSTNTTTESVATPLARPLAEQVPNSSGTPPPSATSSPITVVAPVVPKPATAANKKRSSSSSSSSSRKKSSNGTSLIFKQPAMTSNINASSGGRDRRQEDAKKAAPKLASTLLSGVNNFTIRHHANHSAAPNSSTPIAVIPMGSPSAQAPPPAYGYRTFNSLTPTNQQYGTTRILINEPIYLPRSVGTIAPITTSLPQIANQSRRAPFVSKRAQACLAYQDERKLNHIASIHMALVKVAQNLGVQDRLNLRAASRSWRSVVDASPVWDRVILNSDDENIDTAHLGEVISTRYTTRELIFDQYVSSIPAKVVARDLVENSPHLRCIRFKSISALENSYVCNLINCMREYRYACARQHKGGLPALKCEWQVRVGVDPLGIASVQLQADKLARMRDRLVRLDYSLEKSDIGDRDYFAVEFHDLKEEITEFGDEVHAWTKMNHPEWECPERASQVLTISIRGI